MVMDVRAYARTAGSWYGPCSCRIVPITLPTTRPSTHTPGPRALLRRPSRRAAAGWRACSAAARYVCKTGLPPLARPKRHAVSGSVALWSDAQPLPAAAGILHKSAICATASFPTSTGHMHATLPLRHPSCASAVCRRGRVPRGHRGRHQGRGGRGRGQAPRQGLRGAPLPPRRGARVAPGQELGREW